jgi:3-dehydrosphinganine reductase
MGKEVARQLAQKGANIVIVARDPEKLLHAIDYIKQGAVNPASQRFHHVAADLTVAAESVRVIEEVVAWNGGQAPDTVWCCAGSSYPTLFIDAPVHQLQAQVESNYLTSAYMAHAILTCWLKPLETATASDAKAKRTTPLPPRHLIFTASFLALFSISGYGSYSPTKAALRSLSDTLSQEMTLYAAAYPHAPPVRVHTIFPAAILTESFEAENLIKHDLTKHLEEADKGQTPEVVAEKSIRGLEAGQELVTTDYLTELVKGSVLGGSLRGGLGGILYGWFMAWAMGLAMVFVRADLDSKTKAWGRKFGVKARKSKQ